MFADDTNLFFVSDDVAQLNLLLLGCSYFSASASLSMASASASRSGASASASASRSVASTSVLASTAHGLVRKLGLNQRRYMKHKQTVIRSHSHQMGVYKQNKKRLSPLDTKKWIAADDIRKRVFGHYLTAHKDADAADEFLNGLLGE